MLQNNAQIVDANAGQDTSQLPLQTRNFKVKKWLLIESIVCTILGVSFAYFSDKNQNDEIFEQITSYYEPVDSFQGKYGGLILFMFVILIELTLLIGIYKENILVSQFNVALNICFTLAFAYVVFRDLSNFSLWFGLVIYPYISLIAIAYVSDLKKIKENRQGVHLDAV